MNQELVPRLRHLDACAVSDALDRLGIDQQVATGLAQQSTTHKLVGRVVTYRLVPAGQAPKSDGPVRHLGTTAIELAAAGEVIVVEQRTGIEAGCWGGLLTLGAKVRGVAGVIADGPLRDVDEAVAYEFPIFSRSLTALTARGRVVEKGTNVPVRIGEIAVDGGDYVLCDGSGAIFIAAADIERVLQAAETIVAKEAAMARAILGGTAIGQVMAGNYEHMLEN